MKRRITNPITFTQHEVIIRDWSAGITAYEWIKLDLEKYATTKETAREYFLLYITEGSYPNEWLKQAVNEYYPPI